MRTRWIDVGTRLFGENGFESTSTTALLEAAGASKGALYHHFSSKQSLFEAVFTRVSEDAIGRASRQPGSSGSAAERLITGALAWLDEVRDPRVARVLLEDGPRVLGFERARDLEARTSLALMSRSLAAAVRAGEIHLPDLDLMAHLLNAVLAEAALIERRDGAPANRARIEACLRALVEGLRR